VQPPRPPLGPREGQAVDAAGPPAGRPDDAPLDVERISQDYFPRIRRAALLLTGNPWDADDLAQETFAVFAHQEAGRAGTRFAGRSRVYTWLYGILLNLERRERRRLDVRRRKLRVLWEEGQQGGRPRTDPETPVELAEWKTGLWGLVAGLPDGQRQALVLRFGQGLRYDEVATVLGCPLGTVKSRVNRARNRLVELLDLNSEAEIGPDNVIKAALAAE